MTGPSGLRRWHGYTAGEWRLILWKRLLSYGSRSWDLDSYPVRVRLNPHSASDDEAFFADLLNWPGPFGFGATPADALASLAERLSDVAAYRREHRQPMPRPGAHVPIGFASTERLGSRPLLLKSFIVEVLGFGPDDPVFISDESRLSDFGDEEAEAKLRQKVLDVYQVDLSDLSEGVICDILDRVAIHSRRWRELD